MSDHNGDIIEDPGYDTPVPELDDHRHHSTSSQRVERPRRGTFDSLYGARQAQAGRDQPETPVIRVRDFEEAIDDSDGNAEPAATPRRARRPTVESVDREVSPPNSVKAFAAARRRERGPSFSSAPEDDAISRVMSMSSRRSARSKPQTLDKDSRSMLTNKTAEEDVCFPHQDPLRKDGISIDFDFLENFLAAEQAARVQSREEIDRASFTDLQLQNTETRRNQVATADGDILDMPSDDSVAREKADVEEQEKQKTKPQPHPVDSNRFSFFSSAWESTIHAPEMSDLVLPGESLQNLFELPQDESDGVWWLNVNSATKEEVQGICKAFGIHPLTIEDIITQEAREKIELFPSYYFACFRSFYVVEEPEGKEYEPLHIYVVVFREGTLSFSFQPNSHASQVRKRITALRDYVSLSSDWICYALM